MKSLANVNIDQMARAAPIWIAICCTLSHGCHKGASDSKTPYPAQVEKIEDSDLSRLVLSDMASVRLGLQVAKVSALVSPKLNGALQMAVLYSALLYDAHGKTWIYVQEARNTFVRHQVRVDYIRGGIVFLKAGPPIGTLVATVAVAELYGTEFEVGH
jgi:hypothetical protein